MLHCLAHYAAEKGTYSRNVPACRPCMRPPTGSLPLLPTPCLPMPPHAVTDKEHTPASPPQRTSSSTAPATLGGGQKTLPFAPAPALSMLGAAPTPSPQAANAHSSRGSGIGSSSPKSGTVASTAGGTCPSGTAGVAAAAAPPHGVQEASFLPWSMSQVNFLCLPQALTCILQPPMCAQ